MYTALAGHPHSALLWSSANRSTLMRDSLGHEPRVPLPSYMVEGYAQRVIPRQSTFGGELPDGDCPWGGPTHIGRQYRPAYSPLALSKRLGNHSSCCGSTGLAHPAVLVSEALRGTSSADALTAPVHSYTGGSSHRLRPTTGGLHDLGASLSSTAVMLKPPRSGDNDAPHADQYHTSKRLLLSMQQLAAEEARVHAEARDTEARAQRYWLSLVLSSRASRQGVRKSRHGAGQAVWAGAEGAGQVGVQGSLPLVPSPLQDRPTVRGVQRWATHKEFPGTPTAKRRPGVIYV